MLNEQEETLFDAARKLSDPAQRKAFLDAACDKDSELRQRLEQLLTNAIHAEKFFRESGAPSRLPSEREVLGDNAAKGGTVRLFPDEQPKESIGRYKIREKIGEGGCGVVYVAEQEEPVRRRVALKLIKPAYQVLCEPELYSKVTEFEALDQNLRRIGMGPVHTS